VKVQIKAALFFSAAFLFTKLFGNEHFAFHGPPERTALKIFGTSIWYGGRHRCPPG